MKQFHTKCGKTKELPRNGINLKKKIHQPVEKKPRVMI